MIQWSSDDEPLISFTIYGQQARKSNSRRITTGRNGKPRIIKSEAAQAFEKAFHQQVTVAMKLGIRQPVAMYVNCYYNNVLSDLSIELVKDCCERAGILANDVLVKSEHLEWLYDKEEPRVEISIHPIQEFPVKWLPSTLRPQQSNQDQEPADQEQDTSPPSQAPQEPIKAWEFREMVRTGKIRLK